MQTNGIDTERHKQIQQLLASVLSRLHQARITRNSEIIECIAYLLLEDRTNLNEELRPRLPRSGYGGYEIEVRQLLTEAIQLAREAAILFDRYVLFQSFEVEQQGTYPIPRHIVRFMLDTLQIRPGADLADLTCGSGGFLVHRNTRPPVSGTTNYGVDIAPEWVRIAYANAVLHNIERTTEFVTGDAFQVCYEGKLQNTSFDYIAMAPPFGIPMDTEIVRRNMNVKAGRISEQLFIRLALEKLQENGKAIIMVPNSLLTTNRNVETLKHDIFTRHTLRAVISLGAGALQPFNNTDTGLLLLEKNHSPTTQTWMFHVENDGYPRSRRRDITREPEANDFSYILSALHTTDFRPVPARTGLNASFFSFARLPLYAPTQSESLLNEGERGYILRMDEQAVLQAVWLIEERTPEPSPSVNRYLLVKTAHYPDDAVINFLLPLAANIEPTQTGMRDTEGDEWLKRLSDTRSGTLIFDNKDGIPDQTVAILPDGRLLGCTRPSQSIDQTQYDLRPSAYLKSLSPGTLLTREQLKLSSEQEMKELAGQGAAIFPIAEKTIQQEESAFASLHKVKLQQERIRHHADYLLGQLEMKPFKEIPPRLAEEPGRLQVLKSLDDEQRAIWQTIQQFVDAGHPYHFTRSRLYQKMKMEQKDVVKLQSTLDLLEQLGVIVRVTVNPDFLASESSRSITYHRMVTEYDIVPPPTR